MDDYKAPWQVRQEGERAHERGEGSFRNPYGGSYEYEDHQRERLWDDGHRDAQRREGNRAEEEAEERRAWRRREEEQRRWEHEDQMRREEEEYNRQIADEVEDVCKACGEPGYCSCCAADDARKRRLEEGE